MAFGENLARHSVEMINLVISENEGRPAQDHLNAHVQTELKEYDKLQGTKKKQSFKLTWGQVKVQTLTVLYLPTQLN